MLTRVISISLLFLLVWTSFSCTTSSEGTPEPQKNLVGRWNEQSWQSTIYDDDGTVIYSSYTSSTPNYYVFNADKTFVYHSVSLGADVPGTYIMTPPSLTMAYQAGTFNGKYEIIEFTPSKLVLTTGKPKLGIRNTVEVMTLVKN